MVIITSQSVLKYNVIIIKKMYQSSKNTIPFQTFTDGRTMHLKYFIQPRNINTFYTIFMRNNF